MAYNPRFCGCWYVGIVQHPWGPAGARKYLPQVQLSSSTTILATTSRTTLRQTFINPEATSLKELQYTFPLYDGVSVVGFTCSIGSKTIVGIVKEKQQAKVDYQEAVARGETAGLLQQLPEASDVFTTSIGNVPANEKVLVEITYLGELKHDAETDGTRFTIPTIIAPRYGLTSTESSAALAARNVSTDSGIAITVDVTLEANALIRGLQSPSHPIAVTMGRTSVMDTDAFDTNRASATLTLGNTELDKDFVIVILSKGNDIPRALLETHPTIPNQRALMTTLVPKFNLPNISPEIVFVVDRSGSMDGKIALVVAAMKIFLKSLPIGVKFNICSFGSNHSFLFNKSKTYDQSSLADALKHLESFAANFGGTEMLEPVRQTVSRRFTSLPLEVMILTDGEIWNQNELFNYINGVEKARFFTLGIGNGASSALVQGIARAGNGFAQFVGEAEKMDNRVVRMLKGALTPHIADYSLDITYDDKESSVSGDDFEMVDSFNRSAETLIPSTNQEPSKKVISLFDPDSVEEPTNPPAGRYDHLPNIDIPAVLQTPQIIPALFSFNRTTVYLILGPTSPKKAIKSVKLRGTSEHGILELEIPVQDVGPGQTIHQLAAKKAVQELESGRGWLIKAQDSQSRLLKTLHDGQWDLIVEREAVRLGVQFQVGGKWTSFVAVENQTDGSKVPVDSINTMRIHSDTDKRKSKSASSFPPATLLSASFHGQGSSPFGTQATRSRDQPGFGSSWFGNNSNSQNASSTVRKLSGTGLFGSTIQTAGSGTISSEVSPSGNIFGQSPLHMNLSSSIQTFGYAGQKIGPSTRQSAPYQQSTQFPSTEYSPAGALLPPPVDQDLLATYEKEMAEAACMALPDEDEDDEQATDLSHPSDHNRASSVFASFADTNKAGEEFSRGAAHIQASRKCKKVSGGHAFGGGGALASLSSAAVPKASKPSAFGMAFRSAAPLSAPTADGALTSERKRSGFGAAVAGVFGGQQSLFGSSNKQSYTHHYSTAATPAIGVHEYAPQSPFPVRARVSAPTSIPPAAAAAARPPPPAPAPGGAAVPINTQSDHALQDYQMQLMLLEQQNKKRFMMRRASEAEAPTPDARTSSTAADPTSKMHALIELQAFDGSWSLSKDLLGLINVPSTTEHRVKDDKTWATVLAVAWLEKFVAAERDVWEMVVDKAKAWLKAQTGSDDEVSRLISAASDEFTSW